MFWEWERLLKSNRPENLIYLLDKLEENVMKTTDIRNMNKYDAMSAQSAMFLQEWSYVYEILLGSSELRVGEWNRGDLAVLRN